MDLLGMYSGSESEKGDEESVLAPQKEAEGQSNPDDMEVQMEEAKNGGKDPPEAEAGLNSPQTSQLNGHLALDGEHASHGDDQGFRAAVLESEPPSKEQLLESLPMEFRDAPPGDPFPGITANVEKWIYLKEGGLQLSAALQQRRDFCNPYMMNMMIEYNQLNEYGSCYPPELWDPAGIFPCDYAECLRKEQFELQKRRAEDQRSKGRIDFAQGGVQSTVLKSGTTLGMNASGVLPVSQTGSSVSVAAAAALAKAKAAAAAANPLAPKTKRASKWDSAANPLLK